jgi:N-acetylneuraminic acid mutarotase
VHRSHLFFSDDGGRTWVLGASADPGTNESQVVELADGRLLLNMRNHPAKAENFRMIATSDDGGRTLSTARPDPLLIEPPAQASLLRSDGRLLFANPASTKRERLTVRLSDDNGATWPCARVIHEGPAAYSSLVVMRAGLIGVLFERGERSPYEKITFARFGQEWLIAGRTTTNVTPLPALPDQGVAGAFAGIISGHLLVAGGANFRDGVMPWHGGTKVWHDRVLALDLEARDRAWHEIGRLPAANAYGVSLTVSEGVLIIGGGNAERHFADVWVMTLNGDKPSYRALPQLPIALAQMAGAAVARRIHIAGGIERPDATIASAQHWMLDLDALDKGWQVQPPIPAAGRILATAAATDGVLYVLGGCALTADAAGKPARTYLREAWKFADDQWIKVTDLLRPSAAAASPAPVQDHRVFIISGDDGAQVNLASPDDHKGFARDILRFDPAKNLWDRVGALDVPAPVTLPVVRWQQGFIFVSGEVRPGVRTRDVFQWFPAR